MDEKALTELLECSVCLDQLDETSKVLPCQHTFCKRCLDGIVNSKRELRCPECRFVVETRVEDLPSNILLIRLLESMKIQSVPQMLVHKHRTITSTSPTVTVPLPKQSPSPVNTSQPCAKSLYNYEAKEPGDLSFKKGDVILLKRQVDENWFHGEFQGKHGFFPASYVQVTTPLPQEIPTCKALYDFVINDQNEKDCLTFNKDEMITVIRRVDDNWAEGKFGEKIGIFPISFVEMNDAAKWLINSQISSTSPGSPGLQFLVSNGSNIPPHPGMPQNSAAYILHHPSLSGLQSANKRHSLTTITMGNAGSQPSAVRQMQPNRHSMEVQCLVNLTSPPSSVSRTASSASCIQHNMVFSNNGGLPHKSYLQHPQLPNSTASVPVSTSQSLPVTAPTVIYVALYNYTPQKDDEIELRKGDCYMVSEKCQDGWFKGTCLRSSKQGVFPGNYVRLVKPSAKQPSLGAAGLKMGVNSAAASQSHRVHHIIGNSRQPIPKTAPSVEGQSRPTGHPAIRRSKSNGSPDAPLSSRVKRSPSMNTASERTEEISNRASDIVANRQNSRSNSELDSNGNITQGAIEQKLQSSSGKSAETSPNASAQSSPSDSSPRSKATKSAASAPVTRDSSIDNEANTIPTASEQESSPSSRQSSSGNSPQKETGSSKVPKLRTLRPCEESQSSGSVSLTSFNSVNESNLVVNLSVTAPSATSGNMSVTSNSITSTMSTSAPASLQDTGRTYKLSSKDVSSSSSNVETVSFPSGPSPPVPKRHPRSKSGQNRSRQPPTPPIPASIVAQHSTAPTSNVKAPPNVVIGAVGGSSNKSADALPMPTKVKKERKERDKLSAALRKLTKSKKTRSPSHEVIASGSDSVSVSHQRSASVPTEAGKGPVVAGHHKVSSSEGSAMVTRPYKPKPLIRERARCIVPYPPQSDIELELKVGDVVYVHRKREDGWFKGTLQRTGKTGLFPGSFVETY